jgi:hypothetical protein
MSQSILSQDPRVGKFAIALVFNDFLEPLRWVFVVLGTPKIAPYLSSKSKSKG